MQHLFSKILVAAGRKEGDEGINTVARRCSMADAEDINAVVSNNHVLAQKINAVVLPNDVVVFLRTCAEEGHTSDREGNHVVGYHHT